MKQIQIPNEIFTKSLGYQKPTSEVNNRLLAYSLIQTVPEGALLYNTLSCEMVLLDSDELKDMYSSEYLRSHWFIVPECFDDRKFARQFRTIHQLFVPKNDTTKSYTILTTTDCNARCFYCYEKGRSRIPMSLSTADKLVDYIISNYNKDTSEKKSVLLNWFGGEPLYNSKVIYRVCQKLTEAGVNFKSEMTSNGYLFDKNIVSDAKKSWHLRMVQITLDGTEKVYNRSKAFIYEGVNAYQRVMDNISDLVSAGIHVSVRLNIDMYNADDLMSLVDILSERYGKEKKFSCYCHPLFELAGDKPHERTEEKRQQLYQKTSELNRKLEATGLRHYGPVAKVIPTARCMADNGRSVVVVPTGQIGLCEHFSESEFFSHLDTPDVKDKETVRRFRERCDDLELCYDCPVYPQCIRLKMCLEGALCFAEIRQQSTDNIKKSMLVTYEKWKKKQNENTVADDESDDIYILNKENC